MISNPFKKQKEDLDELSDYIKDHLEECHECKVKVMELAEIME